MDINTCAFRIQKQVETKAYAFGTTDAVAALLGEYARDLFYQFTTHGQSYEKLHPNALVQRTGEQT